MIVCPDCENDIDVDEDELEEGEVVSCTECGSDFEVVTTEPLELSKVAEEEDEDDDDDKKEEESEDGDY
jgi:alpha-aminoadipate/glutamate carrier protein LysW